ncbi:hypothetical protein BJ165DRAFT_1416583 [Panaeolus papilionaceus]|nr:hypothetical protein BJ165DRAFT_1416583 [Panaeolus papilionaceus]
MSSQVVLITGAAGFLGSLVRICLLILSDTICLTEPATPSVVSLVRDLTQPQQAESLFNTAFGIPDVIYCLHGIMSRGAEDNFDIGMKINVDSVRTLLEVARRSGKPGIKFIFASSLAVYGGPLPEIIVPSTIALPQSSYGMEKLMVELLINEYSRRGWVDGRVLRLPTIVVRAGAPSNATSSFLSGIIREPLQGLETTCPIGNSSDSPELSLKVWLASPETTIKNFLIAKDIPSHSFLPHTRVVCLPGFTASVKEELEALEKVGGKTALQLVKFQDDPTNRRIVASWPSVFDNTYALELGFSVDEGGIEPVVRRFQQQMKAS